MADSDRNSTTPPVSPPTSELAPESINQSSQSSPLSPVPSQESTDYFEGWKIIGEQCPYNEQDYLHPSHNLASKRLKARGEDDIVIFDYFLGPGHLNREDGNPFEEGGPSSGHFSADDDIFFQVSKNELIESKQFDQIISPTKEPRLTLSRGPRLGIM